MGWHFNYPGPAAVYAGRMGLAVCRHQPGTDHHGRRTILDNIERHKVNDIGEQLAGMREISEVYSVSGHDDLIAIVRVERNDDLAELVTSHRLKIDGNEKTKTRLAFKAYSRHDPVARFTV